jgi:putative glutamine amidotransferase
MTVQKNITIGITEGPRYENYERWILSSPGTRVIRLSYKDPANNDIGRCDGLLLTGGQDVHPKFYKKPEYLQYSNVNDIDEKRDEFELQMLDKAMENQLPVLGICRGLQVCNVYLGGTLVPDLPSSGKQEHSAFRQGEDRYHPITVHDETALKNIIGARAGEINSAHHQSAATIAPELMANAISPDGVVEGLERKNPEGKPYLLLVQWHPERMNDQQSAFSNNIRESFLDAVRKKHSRI